MSATYQWIVVAFVVGFMAFFAAPALGAQLEGTITDMGQGTVTVIDKELQTWSFHVDEATRVMLNGKEGKLSDLRPGDTVNVNHEQQEDTMHAKEIRRD